jgi:hypothetical protein
MMWAIALVATAIGLEVVSAASIVLREGRYTAPGELLERTSNTFVRDLTGGRGACRYVDTLFPHPYLAFVHHGNPPCGVPGINNVGLFGDDFPIERRPDRFVILLTGGSVAAQLGQLMQGHPKHLEIALNDGFVSPDGRPFLVLNGGDGAWKQPQQLILFSMYADVVDGVVTLDGANESRMLESSVRFEYPASNFMTVNPMVDRSFSQVVTHWIAGRALGALTDSTVLSRSHTAYVVARALERWAASGPREDRRVTSLEALFAVPQDWSAERRFDANVSHYQKYIRAMDAIARDRRVLTAHFIQPVPAIGKVLTAEERAVAGDLDYADVYLRMTQRLLEMKRSGTHIHDLLDVFEKERDSLYEDSVHLRKDADGGSRGYRLMAERMAETLAVDWRLGRKPGG